VGAKCPADPAWTIYFASALYRSLAQHGHVPEFANERNSQEKSGEIADATQLQVLRAKKIRLNRKISLT